MSRVLVLGATGYIGFPVAKAFERLGYRVYGLARSEEKAKLLTKHEIIPVIGQGQDVNSWLKVAEESDIIIEAISDYSSHDTVENVSKALTDLAKRKPHTTVIFSSGTWNVGNTKGVLVDEHTPRNAVSIVAYKNAIEDLYLAAGAILLRPTLVYGGAGSLTGIWFKQIEAGKFTISPDQITSLVHVEDLAEAYVLLARTPSARGQTYNIGAQNESTVAIAHQARRILNPKLEIVQAEPPAGTLEEGLGISQTIDFSKIKVLGWNPTHPEFLGGLQRYYNSWKAHQE